MENKHLKQLSIYAMNTLISLHPNPSTFEPTLLSYVPPLLISHVASLMGTTINLYASMAYENVINYTYLIP